MRGTGSGRAFTAQESVLLKTAIPLRSAQIPNAFPRSLRGGQTDSCRQPLLHKVPDIPQGERLILHIATALRSDQLSLAGRVAVRASSRWEA
jgi:hypothetical protein